jgi:hypothetical protein
MLAHAVCPPLTSLYHAMAGVGRGVVCKLRHVTSRRRGPCQASWRPGSRRPHSVHLLACRQTVEALSWSRSHCPTVSAACAALASHAAASSANTEDGVVELVHNAQPASKRVTRSPRRQLPCTPCYASRARIREASFPAQRSVFWLCSKPDVPVRTGHHCRRGLRRQRGRLMPAGIRAPALPAHPRVLGEYGRGHAVPWLISLVMPSWPLGLRPT